MAVDTARKRISAINHGCPWRGLLPIPDGTVFEGDRQHLAFLYAGILAALPVFQPLGDPVIMSQFPYHELSRPLAVTNPWMQLIDAGGMDDADNGGSDITNPDTQISGADHHVGKVNKRGTFLQVRLVYDDGLTGITDPVIQAFGRYNADDAWQRLRNLSGSVDVTLATNAIDVTDGTNKYTDIEYQDQVLDLNGCDEVTLGVKTALAATGDVTTAVLQAKLIGGIRTF